MKYDNYIEKRGAEIITLRQAERKKIATNEMRRNDCDEANGTKCRPMTCTSVKCNTVYINCQLQKVFTTKSIKTLSIYDDFIASCCDQDSLSENNKEKGKRV